MEVILGVLELSWVVDWMPQGCFLYTGMQTSHVFGRTFFFFHICELSKFEDNLSESLIKSRITNMFIGI